MTTRETFPCSLLLGVATSSVQIEGGDRNNSWFDWSQRPGKIRDGSTPERATDHWERWCEDSDLMAQLGIQTYRMSVEWARVEPIEGHFDDAVLSRYLAELSYVAKLGIVPLVTLHHFSNPRWFQELGEFQNPRSPELFERFVRVVVGALNEVVSDWVTINEPNVYAAQCYLFGEGPPGRGGWPAVRTALRHLAIAHCRSYLAIHEAQPTARVGFAHHLRVFEPLRRRNPVHRAAARSTAYLFQEAISQAFLTGRFPKLLGHSPVAAGIYYDYLGINYYSRSAVRNIGDGTFPNTPVNDLGWEIHPDGLVTVARWLHDRYPGPIWITENGTCDNAERFRSRFIHEHLHAISDSELPFERYYHWCFVDNWEWHEGEVPRFGLVALDYATQRRTVKPSGRFYADIIANRGVTPAALATYVEPQRYSNQPAT